LEAKPYAGGTNAADPCSFEIRSMGGSVVTSFKNNAPNSNLWSTKQCICLNKEYQLQKAAQT